MLAASAIHVPSPTIFRGVMGLGRLRFSGVTSAKAAQSTPSKGSEDERKMLIEKITERLQGTKIPHPNRTSIPTTIVDKSTTGDSLTAKPIAIEVDGPSHFYVNTTKYTAYTKLKHRLLTRMGYKVLHVPYFDWRKLRGAKERENYMREKLKEEPTEWLAPEDEELYAERIKAAEEKLVNKPAPPKTPRPSRKSI